MINRLIARVRRDRSLKELLRHSGIMYASGLVSTLLLIGQQLSTANRLGAADYGRLATVLGSGALVMFFVDVRTWEVATKLLARPVLDKDHTEIARVITWLTLVDLLTGLVSVLVVILFAAPIATYLLQLPELDWLVRLYALALPFRILSNGTARTVLRLYNRFDWLSVKSIVYSLSSLVFITGAVLLGFGLPGAVFGAVLAEIVGAGIQLIMQVLIYRRELPGKPLVDFLKPRQFVQGVSMLKGLWLSATLAGLQSEIIVPILALLTSPAHVGLFRSGLDIAQTIEKLLMPFMLVLFPQIVKSYEQHNRTEFLRLIKQAALLMALLTVPFVAAIILLGPFVFPRLLGADFSGVTLIAGFIALGFLIYGVLMWTRPALIAFNRLRELNLVSLGMVLLTVAALFLTAPTWGAAAAAAVRGGVMALQNLLLLGVFWSVFPHITMPQEQSSNLR